MRQLKTGKQATNTTTPRDEYTLQTYLNEIAKIPLISEKEEVELAQRIRQGDKQALEKLTRANLRFVVSVAKQYQGQGLPLQDLVSEGNLGIVKAAQRFDETRGFKFISYAVRWIRQSILHALAEYGRVIRLPLNKIGYLNQLHKAQENFRKLNGRDAIPEELAGVLETDIDVSYIQQLPSSVISFESPVLGSIDDNTFLDLLGSNDPIPDSQLICESIQQDVFNLISCLNTTEKQILIMSYGLKGTQEKTLDEMAKILGKSGEEIKQLKDAAIRKLKRRAKTKYIRMPVE